MFEDDKEEFEFEDEIEFETADLLSAVGEIDKLRRYFSDQDDGIRPPRIRDDLLKLHRLAMEHVNEGAPISEEFQDLAFQVEDEIDESMDSMKKLQKTLEGLMELMEGSSPEEA